MAVTREERMWEAMLNDAPEKIPTAVTRKEKMLKKLAKQACDNDTFSGGGGEPLANYALNFSTQYSGNTADYVTSTDGNNRVLLLDMGEAWDVDCYEMAKQMQVFDENGEDLADVRDAWRKSMNGFDGGEIVELVVYKDKDDLSSANSYFVLTFIKAAYEATKSRYPKAGVYLETEYNTETLPTYTFVLRVPEKVIDAKLISDDIQRVGDPLYLYTTSGVKYKITVSKDGTLTTTAIE